MIEWLRVQLVRGYETPKEGDLSIMDHTDKEGLTEAAPIRNPLKALKRSKKSKSKSKAEKKKENEPE